MTQATAPIPTSIDLSSGAAIKAIIENAAQTIIDNAPPNTDTVDPASIAATAAAAANVISSGNAVIEAASGQTGVELLTTLAQVAIVASDAAASCPRRAPLLRQSRPSRQATPAPI